MILQTKNWYVLYTKPRWEKKVAKQLENKRIEHYCPLNRVVRQWSDRKKIVLEPLFSSYVFIRIDDKDMAIARQLDGVMNYVYWLKKPAVVREEEIRIIQRFLNDYQEVQVERTSVNVNDVIRITEGPFMEKQGNVVEIRKNTVKVSLPNLGYTIVAEVKKSNIEIIPIYSADQIPA
ncbi:MAG: UpxY family transcription antiterminator [Bacteroidetes bacterium]|nr:UpxY family transcription antiterminator [Bacteroidota bacterium]